MGQIDTLSTDELVLFNFLALIVDIRYRAKYGRSLEWNDGKGYSKDMLDNSLPAQLPSVDSRLEGTTQRRITDEV